MQYFRRDDRPGRPFLRFMRHNRTVGGDRPYNGLCMIEHKTRFCKPREQLPDRWVIFKVIGFT